MSGTGAEHEAMQLQVTKREGRRDLFFPLVISSVSGAALGLWRR